MLVKPSVHSHTGIFWMLYSVWLFSVSNHLSIILMLHAMPSIYTIFILLCTYCAPVLFLSVIHIRISRSRAKTAELIFYIVYYDFSGKWPMCQLYPSDPVSYVAILAVKTDGLHIRVCLLAIRFVLANRGNRQGIQHETIILTCMLQLANFFFNILMRN